MKAKKSLNYEIEPDKYIYGMCETFQGPIEKEITPQMTINLMSELGCQSMRLWMHAKWLINREENSNKLTLKEDVIKEYKSNVGLLIKKGVNHLVSMNHSYIYPYDFEGNQESEAEVPLPGSKVYLDFLRLIEDTYELLTKTFPEIIYWEVGNEVNTHRFICKPFYPKKDAPKETEYDEKYCYTFEEKAQITADICYYANKGVKKGNPNAFVVFPAPTPYFGYTQLAWWMEQVYLTIESGKFPTGLKADTNPDNYFQILSWHPYNFGGDSSIFVNGCNEIYDVAIKHGDEGKKVFLTEFGYHDNDFIKQGMTRTEADEKQASFFKTDFLAFRKYLPYVETVHIFRLFDWTAGPGIEIDFGMFRSPMSEYGIVPKAKGMELFKLIKGENADAKKLYMYSRIRK